MHIYYRLGNLTLQFGRGVGVWGRRVVLEGGTKIFLFSSWLLIVF